MSKLETDLLSKVLEQARLSAEMTRLEDKLDEKYGEDHANQAKWEDPINKDIAVAEHNFFELANEIEALAMQYLAEVEGGAKS